MLGTNTLSEKHGPTVIKLSVFLKKTPTQISKSDDIALETLSDVENTLSFSDLTLRYLM
jgi:hypothetical protein